MIEAKDIKKIVDALNNYLFNVEYGYAPEEKTGCRKKLIGSDKYWTDEEEKIRIQKNLKLLTILNPKAKKKDLKKEVKIALVKYKSDEGLDVSRIIYYDFVPLLLQGIKDIEKERKKARIPYFCTNDNKFSQIGSYKNPKLPELLYVTDFEQKLDEVEKMLRATADFNIDEYTRHQEDMVFIKSMKDIDNFKEVLKIEGRDDFVDTEKRDKRIRERTDLLNSLKSPYGSVKRWWSYITKLKMCEKFIEIKKRYIMKFDNDSNREAIIKSFNDNADKVGWGKDLYGSIDIQSEFNTENNLIKTLFTLRTGKVYTKEEMESMTAYVKNLFTQKMNINVKDFVKPFVENYNFEKTMKVDIKEAFIIETWLKYRYDKLFTPIKYTTKVPHPKLVNYEENGKKIFFGGTLQGGRKGAYDDFPNGCVYFYRSPYNIRTALLDYRPTDKTQQLRRPWETPFEWVYSKKKGVAVLKHLLPESLWDTAVVYKIDYNWEGEKEYPGEMIANEDTRPPKPKLKF